MIESLYELTRGTQVESIHYGDIAVVNSQGMLVYYAGDPENVTFLRSTAKPLQLLPFIENGGQAYYGLSLREIALMCASHSGTDEHLNLLRQIHAKVGITEAHLQCGMHPPAHKPTADALKERGEELTSGRHNCSGKHTGMLAFAQMNGWDLDTYLDNNHPAQRQILKTFAEMCELEIADVRLGVDGCSAPIFGIPLRHAALGFARLCDPSGLPAERASACRIICTAMTQNPDMVAGPERFDTLLMQSTEGQIITKAGAEGYQGIGLLPGALGLNSEALGITIKIHDGDARGWARPAVAIESLKQLGALNAEQLKNLSSFGPTREIRNWKEHIVGEARPCFKLHQS